MQEALDRQLATVVPGTRPCASLIMTHNASLCAIIVDYVPLVVKFSDGYWSLWPGDTGGLRVRDSRLGRGGRLVVSSAQGPGCPYEMQSDVNSASTGIRNCFRHAETS